MDRPIDSQTTTTPRIPDLLFQMVEQAPTGIYVVDDALLLQHVNRLAAPVFRSVQPLLGRDFADIIAQVCGSEIGANVVEVFRHTLETGEKYVSPTLIVLRHDLSEQQNYEWEIQRIALNNRRHCVVCYLRDVTSRLNIERALRESDERFLAVTARLAETERRKDEFLARLAHELRNPLAPISNAIQVMRLSDGLEEGIPELLDVMERQTSHLIQLVDDLVEMHDDQTIASSEGDGNGKLFEVSLLKDGKGIENANVINDRSLAKRIIPARRLIIVDDMRVARVTLERLLITMGQEVRSLDSGEKAFEAAMSAPPDFLVSDIGMPEMDGYELARKIRSEPKLRNVILVALTGYGQTSDQNLAKEAGFDCHLTKPAKVEDLRELLFR